MICKKCGTEIKRGGFCPRCGAAVPTDAETAVPEASSSFAGAGSGGTRLCGACGTPTQAGQKFCRNCGARLAESIVHAPAEADISASKKDETRPADSQRPIESALQADQGIQKNELCPRCGSPLTGGNQFCMQCGLDRSTPPPPAPIGEEVFPVATPAISPPPISAPSESGPPAQADAPRTGGIGPLVPHARRASLLWVGIAAAVVVMISLGIAGAYYFHLFGSRTAPKTATMPQVDTGGQRTSAAPPGSQPLAEANQSNPAPQPAQDTSSAISVPTPVADGTVPNPDMRPVPPAGGAASNAQPRIPEVQPLKPAPKTGASEGTISTERPTAPASLSIKTNPGGAAVLLDGQLIGTSDATGELKHSGIPPGSHDVIIRKEGFTEARQNLQLAAGEAQALPIILHALPGKLTILVNVDEAEIEVKGMGTYHGRLDELPLPAGAYDIRVSKARYKAVTQTADLRTDRVTALNIRLEKEYSGPNHGTLIWEGEVRGTELVTITDGQPSSGQVSGDPLPGIPCLIQPTDPKKVIIATAPGPANGYRTIVLRITGKGKIKIALQWSLP